MDAYPPALKTRIKDAFREAVRHSGLSPAETAALAGVSEASVRAWLRRAGEAPGCLRCIRLAIALNDRGLVNALLAETPWVACPPDQAALAARVAKLEGLVRQIAELLAAANPGLGP